MITEDYVSFEVAKLLKEKGFDEECYQKYDGEGYLSFNHVGYINAEKPNEDFSALAPTHQMAMAWLREKGIYVEIRRSRNTFLYGFLIFDYKMDLTTASTRNRGSYEEAVEAALKYSLENLI